MIKVNSLISEDNKLIPVEVELTLWPGIPGIQFLGLPDQHLKESAMRIKSAIRAAGFQFPIAQQILVNLRPSHLKKTSRGLELAVATAFLWETGQVQKPVIGNDFFIYGELSLAGTVSEPEDLAQLELDFFNIVLTGEGKQDSNFPFRRQVIKEIRDIERPTELMASRSTQIPLRPEKYIQQKFSSDQAELLKILAVGGHSALLAGSAGSGKSTVANALVEFLPEPEPALFDEIRRIQKKYHEDIHWRPSVKPHHSTPMMAMIGGGNLPFAGEVSRAHGGVLILDELLEFSPRVQEALREPIEEGTMRVFRSGILQEYPAKSQVIATTNLCPCGQWTPDAKNMMACRFSRRKCLSYRERLSGPLLDRFEILFFSQKIGLLEVNGQYILDSILRADEFRKKNDVSLEISKIETRLTKAAELILSETSFQSQRRRRAVLKVSQSLALLDEDMQIRPYHLQKAKNLSYRSFLKFDELV